jgi:predicted RND superfamily exporter protein
LRARALHAIDDAQWAGLEPLLPPADLRPYGLADLPEDLARPFTEKSGQRGRLLVIEPTEGKSDNDLRYLLRWADSFRETRLPDGSLVRGSGRAVIFADMLAAVVADAPRALAVAGLLVALWVILAFGLRRAAFEVLVTLGLGLLWLLGLLALGGVRIHFLNFMALPITLGVGVDYAVNLIARQRQEEDPLRALRTVGGPVALCSLTTILGYLALLGSINQGVRSLGLVAVLGEVCCLLAALLVLPGYLLLRGRAGGGATTRSAKRTLR